MKSPKLLPVFFLAPILWLEAPVVPSCCSSLYQSLPIDIAYCFDELLIDVGVACHFSLIFGRGLDVFVVDIIVILLWIKQQMDE